MTSTVPKRGTEHEHEQRHGKSDVRDHRCKTRIFDKLPRHQRILSQFNAINLSAESLLTY